MAMYPEFDPAKHVGNFTLKQLQDLFAALSASAMSVPLDHTIDYRLQPPAPPSRIDALLAEAVADVRRNATERERRHR